MAAILYRYMNYNNLDTSAGDNTNVLSYSDSFAMSEYAVPAMPVSYTHLLRTDFMKAQGFTKLTGFGCR